MSVFVLFVFYCFVLIVLCRFVLHCVGCVGCVGSAVGMLTNCALSINSNLCKRKYVYILIEN